MYVEAKFLKFLNILFAAKHITTDGDKLLTLPLLKVKKIEKERRWRYFAV